MDKNPILRWITAHLPLVRRYHGEALWIGQGKRRKYTPLFVVLIMIAVAIFMTVLMKMADRWTRTRT